MKKKIVCKLSRLRSYFFIVKLFLMGITQPEILIRGDRRQVSFLSAFIVHATSQEMKWKWANLKELRFVERGLIFLYFFDYFAICFTGLFFYAGAILSDI